MLKKNCSCSLAKLMHACSKLFFSKCSNPKISNKPIDLEKNFQIFLKIVKGIKISHWKKSLAYNICVTQGIPMFVRFMLTMFVVSVMKLFLHINMTFLIILADILANDGSSISCTGGGTNETTGTHEAVFELKANGICYHNAYPWS